TTMGYILLGFSPCTMNRSPGSSSAEACRSVPPRLSPAGAGGIRPARRCSPRATRSPPLMADYDYDLFVIGAGSGGVRAARLTALGGKRVAIAEEFRVGGTCVIRGCVPKKFMVMASEVSHALEIAEGYGWSFEGTKFDWPTFLEAKDVEIARLSGIYAANLGKAGVDLIHGRAVLKDA